jgi:hypothetical protein
LLLGQLFFSNLLNLAFFGGGDNGNLKDFDNQTYQVVDIFNSTSQTWSTSTLSEARYGFATSSIGEIVAFGGGRSDNLLYSVVDMFNVTNNTWFTAYLSQPRYLLASASSTNFILFGGGYNASGYSDVVDIFCLNGTCSSLPMPPTPLPTSVPTPPPSTTPTALPTSVPLSISSQFSSSPFSPVGSLSTQPSFSSDTNSTSSTGPSFIFLFVCVLTLSKEITLPLVSKENKLFLFLFVIQIHLYNRVLVFLREVLIYCFQKFVLLRFFSQVSLMLSWV